MEPTKDGPDGDCCGGAECGCASPKKGNSRLKTLIFAVVMLAALCVGAYSFWSKPAAPACAPGQDCSTGGSCCPSTSK